MTEAWFDGPTAGLVGGVFGSVVGILGGVYGTVAGMLAPRGRGRAGVLVFHWLLLAGGGGLLLVGGYAVATGQPWHVWCPFVLTGALLAVVVGGLTPVLYARYRQAEEWRMARQDAV